MVNIKVAVSLCSCNAPHYIGVRNGIQLILFREDKRLSCGTVVISLTVPEQASLIVN